MTSTPRLPSFYRTVSREFFHELKALLVNGGHLALIAPRQSGKAIVLYELKRLASQIPGADRPMIALLRSFNHAEDSNDRFLEYVARTLNVEEIKRPMAGDSLATRILTLLRRAITRNSSPLWLFVQNVAEFPWTCVRALLMALNTASEDSDLRNRLSVVVTGGKDFIPLTYDANSPYRHADKFFLTGFDQELTRIFFKTRIHGESLEDGFSDKLDSSFLRIDEKAIELLHEQTGGYAHFIEEIALSIGRPSPGFKEHAGSDWPLDRMRATIDRFVLEHMCFDHFCRLSQQDVQFDLTAWQMLEVIVDSGSSSLPSFSQPHLLESSGIARRTDVATLSMASPMWKTYLKRTLTRQRRGDIYALLGEWHTAWGHYEGTVSADCSRPLDGDQRHYLDAVIHRWEEYLTEVATQVTDDGMSHGSREVIAHFLNGAKHLYGCSSGVLFDRTSRRIVHEMKTEAIGDKQVLIESPLEEVLDSKIQLRLTQSRDGLETQPLDDPFLNRSGMQPVLQLQRRDEREIDSASLKRLRRSLRKFWQAYLTAMRVEYDVDLGELRSRHLRVVEKVNQSLSHHPGDMRQVVERAVCELIESGGYFRVLICLVSASGNYIQGVAGKCQAPDLDFRVRTNHSMYPTIQEKDWDVQQWVAIKGQSIAISDATSTEQRSPRTDTDIATCLQMRGIGVVPLIVERPGARREILGTIQFERIDRERPPQYEMESFEILASQIAVAFDQGCRETMLEEALNALTSPFRIVSIDRRVVFRNRAAQRDDKSTARCWQFPLTAIRGIQNQREFEAEVINDADSANNGVNHYLVDQDSAHDEFAAPITDWRSTLDGNVFQAEPKIGFVHHSIDLTRFKAIHDSSQLWLTIRNEKDVVNRILDYFKNQGFRWCRLYLKVGDFVKSFAEFGIENNDVRNGFQNGEFVINLNDDAQQARYLFEKHRDLAVFQFDPSLKDSPVPIPRSGIPTIRTHDNWRKEFNKQDSMWLEAPLIVGDEKIGLIAFSIPEDFGPKQYMLLRWCVMNAAVAIQNAQDVDRKERLLEETAWKAAAELAVHQLSNRLCTVEPDCDFIQASLSQSVDPSRISSVVKALQRTKNATRDSREILMDFCRYADRRPFSDLENRSLATLFRLWERQLTSRYPNLSIVAEPPPDQQEVRCSERGMLEVLEILVANSIRHSQKHESELEIRLRYSLVTGSDLYANTVCIAVQDNGVGIPEKHRARIFNAYFTTHEQGSGLGLSIARSFMRRQCGEITESKSDTGAFFLLYLPRATPMSKKA